MRGARHRGLRSQAAVQEVQLHPQGAYREGEDKLRAQSGLDEQAVNSLVGYQLFLVPYEVCGWVCSALRRCHHLVQPFEYPRGRSEVHPRLVELAALAVLQHVVDRVGCNAGVVYNAMVYSNHGGGQ